MYKEILEEAFKAGKEALEKCQPNQVMFYSADLDDKPLSKGEIGEDCGTAWLDYIDGRSDFVKWAKKNMSVLEKLNIRFQKSVYKGYELAGAYSSIYNGQSIEKKEAFFRAYANVLKTHGIKATVKTYLT
jgi:hypothetical protein